MKNSHSLRIEKKQLLVLLPTFLLLVICLIPVVEASSIVSNDFEFNFGRTESLSARADLDAFGVSLSASLTVSAEIDIPIIARLRYNPVHQTGDSINVTCSFHGDEGSAGYRIYGSINCDALGYSIFDGSYNEEATLLEFDTPVGTKSQTSFLRLQVATINIPLVGDYTLDLVAQMVLSMTSDVTGEMELTGSALVDDVTLPCQWNSADMSNMIEGQISDSADFSDSLLFSLAPSYRILSALYQVSGFFFHVYGPGINIEVPIITSLPDESVEFELSANALDDIFSITNELTELDPISISISVGLVGGLTGLIPPIVLMVMTITFLALGYKSGNSGG